ncbi:MAG: Rrf2 family transcriptional regulator, partial [Dehalococcoidia bacterium]|nr:Rrf2 family transcriptional regulator [Dehalococcoidia bacterium]
METIEASFMLQLNRKADYALRLMLEVGAHTQGPVCTAEVAQRQEIPYQFLRKVVQTLVSSGLLVSERGLHGGLCLARPAETISILDIMRACGSAGLNRCTMDPPRCDRRDTCAAFPVWVEVQREVERVLSRVRISNLVEVQAMLERKGKRGKGRPAR